MYVRDHASATVTRHVFVVDEVGDITEATMVVSGPVIEIVPREEDPR